MDTDRPRLCFGLFPVCAALVIICGFVFIVALRAGQAAPSSSVMRAGTLDLVGVVKDTDGQPVTNASIFIYTAQPRSGPGFL